MQDAQWLTDQNFAFDLYGVIELPHLFQLINFPRKGQKLFVWRMEEIVRVEAFDRVKVVTAAEELERIEEEMARKHELKLIKKSSHESRKSLRQFHCLRERKSFSGSGPLPLNHGDETREGMFFNVENIIDLQWRVVW